MTLLILALCIACLILLITWGKVNPFLAFLLVSILAALFLGIPMNKIAQSVNKGIGDTLGSLVIVIVLGAMLGKLVAESGAAQKIAQVLRNVFGYKYMVWAMTLTGFIVGIPLFYNVGFVLLVPIIFSVAYNFKLPLVFVGLPMLSSLSVMHGFLPPHPSPMALLTQLHADMAMTFFYGIIIAIPAIIIAGPLYSQTLKNIRSNPTKVFALHEIPEDKLPGTANSFISSLLPVILIALTTIGAKFLTNNETVKDIATFFGEPNLVMLLTIIIATYTLGIRMGRSLTTVMNIYAEAVKDISMILLIIGSAGILKQIFIDSGAGNEIATALQGWKLPPLLLAWIVTAILRLCLGSATVAGLTAVGVIYPLTLQTHVDPNLMVLSIGAGSLFCSHVNDTGFWLFKEYFGTSLKGTFRSWSVMETIVSVVGLIGVLVINELL
ncbi:MAG TPA: gluconate:H+ symporter [Chitinophagaceae bacterium]|jgi:Gnt-I system high-affinity gluconate transporter|nr:gluconate:H+ symporter [Chitinophagaceae bacterium]